jgi:hypothetical protein
MFIYLKKKGGGGDVVHPWCAVAISLLPSRQRKPPKSPQRLIIIYSYIANLCCCMALVIEIVKGRVRLLSPTCLAKISRK